MSDFNSLKKEYDDLLQKATNEHDQTARDADIAQLIILKQKMADAITSSLGSAGEEMGEKRQLLLAELASTIYNSTMLLS
jgi:hypothetical protein